MNTSKKFTVKIIFDLKISLNAEYKSTSVT